LAYTTLSQLLKLNITITLHGERIYLPDTTATIYPWIAM